MAYQFGSACYASMADVGRADCAAFQPVTSVAGNIVKSVSCYGSNFTTGSLHLSVTTTDLNTSTSTFQNISHLRSYPACVQTDYLIAAEIIAGGLLALWCVWYGGMKLIDLLNWSRGDQT